VQRRSKWTLVYPENVDGMHRDDILAMPEFRELKYLLDVRTRSILLDDANGI
jgi:hypothetical protein